MKTCQNCGKNIEDAAAFCEHCGAPAGPVESSQPTQPAAPVCSGCGTPIEAGAAFCASCGRPVGAAAGQTTGAPSGNVPYPTGGAAPAMAGGARPAMAGGMNKIPAKVLLIAAAAVVIIAAVLIAVFVIKPASKSTVLYLKDEEISLTDLKKIETFELTDGLFEDEEDAYYTSYAAIYNTQASENGRYLFYPQEVTEDYTFDLYMIDLKANNEKSSSAVKVASGISSYRISKDGSKVFYLDDEKLYYTDLNDKTKIDSDVEYFVINEDGTRLLYMDMDGKLYYSDSKKGGEVEKLDSDVQVEHVSDDLSEIYYLKNDTLYFLEIGDEKVKIDSDVSDVTAVYDTGEVYYVQTESDELSLMDFVTDDMAEADADIEEPDYEDFTNEVTTSSGYTYDETDYDAYDEAYDEYYDKVLRDELREELESYTYPIETSSLYYYDGSESVEIADGVSDVMATGGAEAMVVYGKTETGDLPKVKLSEIEWSYDVMDLLDEAFYGSAAEVFMAIGAVESEIDQETAVDFAFNTSCSALYFLDNYDDEDEAGELYAIEIKGDTAGSPELYDEDVADILRALSDDRILYFKDFDYDDYSGDMYINQATVDTDVYWYSYAAYGNQLCYLTDVDDDGMGTLKIYDGKEAVKIAEDVSDFTSDGDAYIAYLADYDTDDAVGDAYLYNGSKEPQLIDDEVSMLLKII